MKSLRFVSPGLENLALADVQEDDKPGPGEIAVRVTGSSLNGHDLNVVMGRLPVEVGRVLLTDGAGIVEALGDGVKEFAVGDAVVSTFFPDWLSGEAAYSGFARTPGDGINGHGQSLVVRAAQGYTRAPQGWSAIESATLPTAGLTAWRALFGEGQLKAGEHVLLLGTGGVSMWALQMAVALGAHVTITSSSDEKLKRAQSLGASQTINYRSTPDWSAKVQALTNGRGVDLVIETGGPGTLPQSIKAVRIGGKIVLVGVVTGVTGDVPTAVLMGKQITLKGITVGSRSDQLEMITTLDVMGVRPIIDATFPLSEIEDAFRLQATGTHFGKICIEI
jgi:NADPH:quinone reductase-like Zn-dependent oxidoreductase